MVACVGDSGTTNTGGDGGGAGDGAAAADSGGSTVDGSTESDAGNTDSGCGDTQTSATNCGACGHACSMGNACFKGRCANEVIGLGGSPSAADNCALLANGTVWCWGDNSHGELGVGDAKSRSFATQIAVDATGASFDHVVEVGVGFFHACARKDDGSIWCWGLSTSGQTGVAVGANQPDVLAPRRVGNLIGYKALRVGGVANCGIDASNNVYCWGTNDHLILGHASGTNGDVLVPTGSECSGTMQTPDYHGNSTPTIVAGLSGVTQLTVSDQHACAVDGTNTVKCWGADDYDQLGDSINNSQTGALPCAKGVTTVIVPNGPTALGGSRLQTCALYGTAQPARCWGNNYTGQLGIGAADGGPPAPFGASLTGRAASGGNYHLCMVTTAGAVVCSGLNDHNALGSAAPSSDTPQTVLVGNTPIANVVGLASGGLQTCAVRSDGTAWCWGDNTVAGPGVVGGRLGSGDVTAHVGAVKVMGLPQ